MAIKGVERRVWKGGKEAEMAGASRSHSQSPFLSAQLQTRCRGIRDAGFRQPCQKLSSNNLRKLL